MTLTKDMENDLFVADILSKSKTIAMVGASQNWKRPSNFVMKYLQKHGYKVIPVNPRNAGENILGELCYSHLKIFLSKLIWSIYLEEVNIVLLLPKKQLKLALILYGCN